MGKTITFTSTPEEDRFIEEEQKRLIENNPGLKVSKSAAIRSLIYKASTTTDEPGGKPTTLEIGNTFEEVKK